MKLRNYFLIGTMIVASSVSANASEFLKLYYPASEARAERITSKVQRFLSHVQIGKDGKRCVEQHDSVGVLNLAANMWNLEEIARENYTSIQRFSEEVSDIVLPKRIAHEHPDISAQFKGVKDIEEFSPAQIEEKVNFTLNMEKNAHRYRRALTANSILFYSGAAGIIAFNPIY